jgi:D-tagatose-1,6-bisphosphate aldolase subunit GatZ/KbaZ
MVNLRNIIARNRAGEICAIPSVCSAHPEVLRASLLLAEELNQPVVIEATSNQVNQDGGYTGMRPADFIAFVYDIADKAEVSHTRIAFGGDHLGPQVWRKGPAELAMAKARVMVAEYVRAGFTKIHLDCSEGCMGEPAQLGDAQAASRAADLAAAALAASDRPDSLMFVIGTEVPPPGGARADEHGDIAPTTPAAATATLAAHFKAFGDAGLAEALSQVIGLVVQPGVEFSPMQVHHLPMQRDPRLLNVLADWPGVCLEAHSTDYQNPKVFPRLAELGFAFQKVGPALTFAYRRAMYALETLRQTANWANTEPLFEVMERIMLADPSYWQGHYHGTSGDLRVERHFGLADRIRYYWPQSQAAVAALLADMGRHDLPEPMLTQVFSTEVISRARALGGPLAEALVLAQIQITLMPYFLDKTAAEAMDTSS